MRKRRTESASVEIPEVANPDRRRRCSKDLRRFKLAYFPHLAYLKMAPFQVERLKLLQHLICFGGKQAKAEQRGGAKTTDSVIAAIWATLNGHKEHFYILKANDAEAQVVIDEIKLELETNDLLLEDFPEVCAPVRALDGAPQRAGRQTVGGERTRISYKSDSIIFPTIAGSVSSGAVISSGGIRGKIRGHKINNKRPDFVLLDDIEDKDSVESPALTKKIISRITQDVGGLAGPGKSCSTLLVGTIMKRRCVIDLFTDREEHPEWQGKRQSALESWPTDEALRLWDEYYELMASGKRSGEDADGRAACRFYRERRAAMDAGAIVGWPDNYIRKKAQDGTQLEISALQHLMNWRWENGEEAFLTECQNQPPDEGVGSGLTPQLVASRLSNVQWRVCPPGYGAALVSGWDIRGTELHFVVMAHHENGSCSIIDKGIDRIHAPEGDLRNPEPKVKQALELATLETLRLRRDMLASKADYYMRSDESPAPVQLTLVDAGWLQHVVAAFVRESGARYRASKGDQRQPGNTRYSSPVAVSENIKALGTHWCARMHAGFMLWHCNSDHFKLYAQERFLQDPSSPGWCSLYGGDQREHRSFAKHICAEQWDAAANKFTLISKFNHFLDCAALCHAAANMLGVRIVVANRLAAPVQRSRVRIPGGIKFPSGKNVFRIQR